MVDERDDFDNSDSDCGEQETERKPKRRRLHGSCDACRKKKVKCDSALKVDNICTNCIISQVDCTHNTPRLKKKKSQLDYIIKLEEKVRQLEEVKESLERYIRTLEEQLRGPPGQFSPVRPLPVDVPSISTASSPLSRDGETPGPGQPESAGTTFMGVPLPIPRTMDNAPTNFPGCFSSIVKDEAPEDTEDMAHINLANSVKNFHLQSVAENRFFGYSSMFAVAEQARDARREHGDVPMRQSIGNERPYFWRLRKWEREFVDEPPNFVFPEADLINSLAEIYFEKVHIVYPAVHRQTFERELQKGTHLKDSSFGALVLGVCAVASRHSDDPRVFLRPEDATTYEGSSAGFKFISQVPIWRRTMYEKTSPYDIQFFALIAFYFIGTAIPQTCWNATGLGIRLAIEKGLHRRKGPDYVMNATDEAERRAFWCLIAADRQMSSFLGRPCALHDEDIDCDYPIECDDEFWESDDPSQAFKQPPGRPSYAVCFTYYLKLSEILGFMTRTLYSTKKSRVLSGLIGEDWETRIVTELDSSLNRWKDGLPQHLQWDPSNPDDKFYSQSLFINITFRYIQMQVHRPFLKKASPLALSSLAICTNTARAVSHMIASVLQRGSSIALYPTTLKTAFSCAMLLIVNYWSSKHNYISYDPAKQMGDIETVQKLLQTVENRWFIAGRLKDMISEFMILRGPGSNAPGNGRDLTKPNKRNRPGGIELPAPRSTSISSPSNVTSLPVQAGMGGFSHSEHSASNTMPPPSNPPRTNIQASAVDLSQWDINSFIFAQMGYNQPPGNNFSVTMPTSTFNDTGAPTVHDAPGQTFPMGGLGSGAPVAAISPVTPMDVGGHAGSFNATFGPDNSFDLTMWLLSTPHLNSNEWAGFTDATNPLSGNASSNVF